MNCKKWKVVFMLFLLCTIGGAYSEENKKIEVENFIKCVEEKNFVTIVDLCLFYKGEIDKIKFNLPEVLWSDSIKKYKESKIAKLSSIQENYLINYEKYSLDFPMPIYGD